jgi:nucleoside-diphosphate-sugar epimerase
VQAAHRSRVLVTGGSGFIGTNVIARLLADGAGAVNLDVAPPRNPAHRDLWREVDLLDKSGVEGLAAEFRPTGVIHLGARASLEGRDVRDYPATTDGTRNLISALEALPAPPRLLVASTRLVCRIGHQPRSDEDYCPPNPYGESKVEQERIVRGSGYGGTWSIVRPTGIWGPWLGTYREFFLAVARGRYRHPAGVPVRKSLGYVENTAHQLVTLLGVDASLLHGRVLYLADYEPVDVADWADRIRRAAEAPPVRTAPVGALRVAALAGDALKRVGWKTPPLTSSRLENLVTDMVYDLEPTRRLVPSLPVDLDEGVARTIRWLGESGALRGAGS